MSSIDLSFTVWNGNGFISLVNMHIYCDW